jgi:hypothetical protein
LPPVNPAPNPPAQCIAALAIDVVVVVEMNVASKKGSRELQHMYREKRMREWRPTQFLAALFILSAIPVVVEQQQQQSSS